MSANQLELACTNPEELKQLLESGLSPDSRLSAREQPLLCKAAQLDRADSIQILVQQGANLESIDAIGYTAVDIAVENNSINALSALLLLGAKANGSGKLQDSPMHTAVSRQDATCAKLLLNHEASVDKRDIHGDTPVHRACLNEAVKCTLAVLSAAPQCVNAIGARGFTPLHIAANQGNSKLFSAIMRYQPKLDIADRQERTALDIVLAKQDTFIIEAMGRRLVNRVLLGKSGHIRQLLRRRHGQQFLHTLHTIDNEFQHNCGANDSASGSVSLLAHIKQPDKFDIAEFVELLTKACADGLAEEISKDNNTVATIANYIFKQVFLTQNEQLMQDLLKLGTLWSAIIIYLESSIINVYNKSVGERKDGIKGLIYRNCMQSDGGGVCGHKLHKMVAYITKLWQLQVEADDSDDEHEHKHNDPNNKPNNATELEAMKDPVESMAVWSVLTGRLRLAPYFLRQEDFDLIPQALLLAKILRSLGSRRDIEDVYADKASKMAITCEGIAMQALRRIKDIDTSQNNMLTMELVQLPLETFGGYCILDLAAKGESSNFVTIDIVQESLDRQWYADFFFVRKGLLMEAVILCGFLPPLFLLVPPMLKKFRNMTPDFLQLDHPGADDDLEDPDDNFDSDSDSESSDDDAAVAAKSGSSSSSRRMNNNNTLDIANADESLLVAHSHANDNNNNNFLQEMRKFYQIPCVKFRIHVAMHVMFVLLLSYIVVKDFGKVITIHEIICYLCLFGFLVEEINEMLTSAKEETITDYFVDGWNIIDLLAIFFGFLAFILRFSGDVIIRYWSLVLLTTTCLAYWVRLLFVSVVLESLGPKLKMMSLMVKKDFLPFLYILFVLMFGFGVTFQALLYPEGKPPHEKAEPLTGGAIFLQMFRNTFYAIVGDYGLDSMTNACSYADVMGLNTSTIGSDSDDKSCKHPIGAILVPDVFMVLYIVIMQILLLNVIVAMFSKTIDAINNESKAMWQFEKYDLVDEFNTRSALPPPFNTLSELRNLLLYLFAKLRGRKDDAAAAAAAAIGADNLHTVADLETQHEIKVYLCGLYYQALAFRNMRATFNGVVLDEEDLDEGNKIIFSQVNDIREKMERLDRLEDTVQKLEKLVKELKALNLRGPSSINPKRRSILAMPFADD